MTDTTRAHRSDAAGKSPLVETRSSMFNMPKNTRTPNVFTTAPRPGGYLQTIVSPNNYNQASINSTLGISYRPPQPSDRSRLIEGFQRLDQWMAPQHPGNPCDEVQSTGRGPQATSADNTTKLTGGLDVSAHKVEAWPTGQKGLTENFNNVMAIAISTIMALAANPGTKPPDHHLSWTINFLNSIKDDENKSPSNIRGIKQLMKPFLDDFPQSFLLEESDKDDNLELHKTQPLDVNRRINTPQRSDTPSTSTPKSKQQAPTSTTTPTPSQVSAVSARNKPSTVSAKRPSMDAGSRNPGSRKSSWK